MFVWVFSFLFVNANTEALRMDLVGGGGWDEMQHTLAALLRVTHKKPTTEPTLSLNRDPETHTFTSDIHFTTLNWPTYTQRHCKKHTSLAETADETTQPSSPPPNTISSCLDRSQQ
jgi:hypothetical protein